MRKSIAIKILSLVVILAAFGVVANLTNFGYLTRFYQVASEKLGSTDVESVENARQTLDQIYAETKQSNIIGIVFMSFIFVLPPYNVISLLKILNIFHFTFDILWLYWMIFDDF